MYVSHIRILNFRNFSRFEVKLRDGINALVGENGVGKTNLLYAMRLVLDSDLSSSARRLDEDDFFSRSGPPHANQVLISLEFAGFEHNVGAEAVVGKWVQSGSAAAHLTYRFRPKPAVRQAIINGERSDDSVSLADYGFERVGGIGDLGHDSVLESKWDEDFGARVNDPDLQTYQFVELPALRDAVRDLRQVRHSPLVRLLQTVQLSDVDTKAITASMEAANAAVRNAEAITGLGKDIGATYSDLTRGLNILSVQLGLTEATIPAILRGLSLLLSDSNLEEFEMSRNGLGFNNLLYAALQIQYFKNRARGGGMGQILAIEEPEAHLHPHAQQNLIRTLATQTFQIILSSHSPDLCGSIGIERIIALIRSAAGTTGTNLAEAACLSAREVADLDRYLDANRGSLLFARKTILVEGPAEVHLVAAFAREVNVDLTAAGVSLISIDGNHFETFVKLYDTGLLGQKCAVIKDGDAHTVEGVPRELYDDGIGDATGRGAYVKTFSNRTTLEYSILNSATAPAIKAAVAQAGGQKILPLLDAIQRGEADEHLIAAAQLLLLKFASRLGKARFAQSLGPLLAGCGPGGVPTYIGDAIAWIIS
jgi:putative ATP-dependent endonuclease of OLD family